MWPCANNDITTGKPANDIHKKGNGILLLTRTDICDLDTAYIYKHTHKYVCGGGGETFHVWPRYEESLKMILIYS